MAMRKKRKTAKLKDTFDTMLRRECHAVLKNRSLNFTMQTLKAARANTKIFLLDAPNLNAHTHKPYTSSLLFFYVVLFFVSFFVFFMFP